MCLKSIIANKVPSKSVLVLFSRLNICRSVASMTWKIFLQSFLKRGRRIPYKVRINSSKGIIIMEPHPNDEQKREKLSFSNSLIIGWPLSAQQYTSLTNGNTLSAECKMATWKNVFNNNANREYQMSWTLKKHSQWSFVCRIALSFYVIDRWFCWLKDDDWDFFTKEPWLCLQLLRYW